MSVISETRYALRVLVWNGGYTAVAALTLALSIGANMAIFSMADAIINRPFPFPELNRMVTLSSSIPHATSERYAVSPADYFDWMERNRVFETLAAYRHWNVRLTSDRESEDVAACQVSAEFFSLLGMKPLRGRAPADGFTEDERNNIVVSYGFWQQRLASDPAVEGRQVNLNGAAYTITGVMPKSFDFPSGTQIWSMWMATPQEARAERAAGELSVIGRLRRGISLAQARSQMQGIAGDLAAKYPATNAGRGVDVRLLADSVDPYAVRYAMVLRAAVAFLLILACANVANLQLARCSARRREMALRVALGARGSQIARQLLLEGTLLSLFGACLGLPLAAAGLGLIKNSIPELVLKHLPGLPYAQIDGAVLCWMLVAAVATGVAFTLPAALQIPTGRAHIVLKERGAAPDSGRLRSALVVSELAFALVLVVGASLVFKSFRSMTPASQGFDPAGVLTFGIRAPEFQYAGDEQVRRLYQETLRRLSEKPEINSAAVISELPALADTRAASVIAEGQPPPPPERPLIAELRITSEDYFRTMKVPIVAGRAFGSIDGAENLPVAVISKAAARRFWPRQDVLGKRVKLVSGGRGAGWFTVIGMAGDVNHFFLDSEIRPTIYVSYRQYAARALRVIVKPAASVERAAAAVRATMGEIDGAQRAYDLDRLSRLFDDLSGGVGVMAALIGIFAILSLTFSASGIYAVMHYTVSRRTQEIGIRMALGASASQVRNLALGSALRLIGASFMVGFPAAWWLSRVMGHLLSGIVAFEPAVLIGASALVGGAGALASYLPARRATLVDPMAAMGRE